MKFDKRNVRWKVDTKAKTVTGTYAFDCEALNDEMNCLFRKAFANQKDFIASDAYFVKSGVILTATARCHPDDEFNVQKGMDIVKYRLIKQFYREKKKAFEAFREALVDTAGRVTEALDCLESGNLVVSDILDNM